MHTPHACFAFSAARFAGSSSATSRTRFSTARDTDSREFVKFKQLAKIEWCLDQCSTMSTARCKGVYFVR